MGCDLNSAAIQINTQASIGYYWRVVVHDRLDDKGMRTYVYSRLGTVTTLRKTALDDKHKYVKIRRVSRPIVAKETGVPLTQIEIKPKDVGERRGGGRAPVIYMKKGSGETDGCPYCGRKHAHGLVEGHRGSHCNNPKEILVKDETFDVSDGYVIKHY